MSAALSGISALLSVEHRGASGLSALLSVWSATFPFFVKFHRKCEKNSRFAPD